MKPMQGTWTPGAVVLAAMSVLTVLGPPRAVADDAAGPQRDVAAILSDVRDRAEAMPGDMRRDIDKRIAITVERVNKEATEKGQTTMVARLAAEFGVSTESFLDQKAEHGLTWGELVVAHTLLANSGTKVTLADLVTLRRDGLSWGAIAFGLQFHMEDFEDAIKAEGRVAMGLSKPDGKAAPIGK